LIEERSPRSVLSGGADERHAADDHRFSPVEFLHIRNVTVREPRLDSERHEEARIESRRQSAHRRLVEVVVVIVRDQDHVDRR